MSADKTVTDTGTAAMHLGWLGDRICLGAGPAKLRFSQDEARALLYGLRDLLTGEDDRDCGCADSPTDHVGQHHQALRARERQFQELAEQDKPYQALREYHGRHEMGAEREALLQHARSQFGTDDKVQPIDLTRADPERDGAAPPPYEPRRPDV